MNNFFSKPRIIVLIVLFLLFAAYIITSYGILAFKENTSTVNVSIEVERGSILDKSGKPLAVDTTFYHLAATPSMLEGKEALAALTVAPVTGLEPDTIKDMILSAKSDFLYIKKKLSESQHDELLAAIEKNDLRGLYFDTIPGRIYPENELASQVIGFMGDNGVGSSGIEYTMQDILSPEAPALNDITENTTLRGKNVYLTIDSTLQHKLEDIAADALKTTEAESLMLLAMEAKTGEIISYISLPSANLNEYRSSTLEEQRNRPTVNAYEPGSVFKIFSVASFIESGAISKDETFVCDGRFEITDAKGEKVVMTCLDHHGRITAEEALKYSCNDALAQMSQKIDTQLFLDYIHNFGFGARTGIELSAETRGFVNSPENKTLWSLRSKPTISIGQEISVSAVQMIQAASALANGGIPVQPTLISKIKDAAGNVEYEHQPVYKDQVISKNTADYILSCMETVAQSGTGHRANIKDVAIGVKTGTAQMQNENGVGYSDTDFLSNCMAIFPIDSPEIILYIVISKAKGETYAGRIVAPVIALAADVIIDHLGMARANAASLVHSGSISFYTGKPVEIGDTIPDFTGTPKKLLTDLLNRTDINIRIEGDGYVVSQNPPPGTPVTHGMMIELQLE
ncbi:MAG: transpeptidase family protein [Treponemataceae bacterium]|nr:transpeptidase family protein [Treponemataceae bacterium]